MEELIKHRRNWQSAKDGGFIALDDSNWADAKRFGKGRVQKILLIVSGIIAQHSYHVKAKPLALHRPKQVCCYPQNVIPGLETKSKKSSAAQWST